MNNILKAIYGGVAAGLGALGTALIDGHVTSLEGVSIASAVLLAFGAVYGVTNIPKAP